MRVIAVVLLLLASEVGAARAQEHDDVRQHPQLQLSDKPRRELLEFAEAAAGASSDDAFLEIRKERIVTLKTLEQIVNTKRSDEQAHEVRLRAIDLLGEYRDPAAMQVLRGLMTSPLRRAYDPKRPLSPYPAADAIIKIGAPAVDTVLMNFGGPLREKKLAIVAHVLHAVDGKELGLCRAQLMLRKHEQEQRARAEKAGKEYQPDQEAENLQRLIDYFQTFDPAQPIP